ncbi:hypothetical protein [Rhodohalobacter mucosus]|nr:hypothetical protein [Rhodohalobacter mucosus]
MAANPPTFKIGKSTPKPLDNNPGVDQNPGSGSGWALHPTPGSTRGY